MTTQEMILKKVHEVLPKAHPRSKAVKSLKDSFYNVPLA